MVDLRYLQIMFATALRALRSKTFWEARASALLSWPHHHLILFALLLLGFSVTTTLLVFEVLPERYRLTCHGAQSRKWGETRFGHCFREGRPTGSHSFGFSSGHGGR